MTTIKVRSRRVHTAWIINPRSSIPVWAARICHTTGNREAWTVKSGDIIIRVEDEKGNFAGVLHCPAEDIEAEYEIL